MMDDMTDSGDLEPVTKKRISRIAGKFHSLAVRCFGRLMDYPLTPNVLSTKL